jgi:glycosyltransferase involved in cell wall biosynthesis
MIDKSNDGLLTIIIPCYNIKPHLTNLQRIINDANSLGVTTILVDDHSTDGAIEELKQIPSNSTVEFYKTSSNLGPGAARNVGISNTKTKYLWFVDVDDIPTLRVVVNQLFSLVDNFDVLRFKAQYKSKSNVIVEQTQDLDLTLLHPNKLIGKVPEVWRYIISIKFLRHQQIFFPEFRWHEDRLFMLRVITNQPYMLESTATNYLYSGTNVSKRKLPAKDFEQFIKELIQMLKTSESAQSKMLLTVLLFSQILKSIRYLKFRDWFVSTWRAQISWIR